MKKIIAFALLIMISTPNIFAEGKRTVGLSASLQSSQFGISLPTWVSSNFVIAPGIHVASAQNIGTEIVFGLAPRYYFRTEKVAPYIGLNGGVAYFAPSKKNLVDKNSTTDIFGGLAVGADYFFTEKFSIGVEAQGNFTKSGLKSYRFGNPDGWNFNTATMVIATIYF